jgi:signal transduction histidine kinase/CheY-like chemotaxis protein
VWLLAFSLAYFVAARLGHALTPQPSQFATFWPPGGLFLGALLAVRWPLVPWVVLAALPPSLASNFAIGAPPIMTIMFFASDVTAALAAAYAIRRTANGQPSLSVLSHVLLYVAGSTLGAALAALGGASTLAAFGGPFGSSFRLWWLGDALGALIVGPFVLSWAQPDENFPALRSRRLLETAALLVFALASTWAVFSSSGTPYLRSQMVLVPCLLWAALRFGQRGATTLGLIVSVAAVSGAHAGLGAFASMSNIEERILATQFFLAIVVVTQLVVAATVAERRKSAEEHRRFQEQLFRAEKLEGIGRLAGGIAHDFNNLLTVINTYAGAVAAVVSDPEVRADVEEIRRAGDRGAALTRQLLALGRKSVVQPQVLDLGRIVVQMEKLLRRAMGEHIDLSIRVAPGLSAVKMDPGHVEQVIMTLALNARDAMPDGGAMTVTVSRIAERHDRSEGDVLVPAGEWVLLAISDSGVGMSEEIRSHLFEPFFTTKDKDHGTGLGLASVFAIVKNGGGHVSASSSPGKGSTFRAYLPRSSELPALERAPSDTAEPHDGRGRTVLLVEDDAGVRAMAVRILANHGYRVLEAASGPEAIALFERHPSEVRLVVTDVVMPRMTGKAVADQLTNAHPGLPVLFVSGYAHDILGTEADLGRGRAFLTKPFSEPGLLDAIGALLDGARDATRQTAAR